LRSHFVSFAVEAELVIDVRGRMGTFTIIGLRNGERPFFFPAMPQL
jgi:hypothetical protein